MTKQLSLKSSVALLKQEAKRWLKAHQQGDLSARDRLTRAWADAPAAPSLRDMQHALAQEYGYTAWTSLLVALDDLAIDAQARAQRLEAILRHGWDGDAARARRILSRDADVYRGNIFAAAACGDVAEVQRLLERSPQLAHQSDDIRGWTALNHVAYGRLDALHAVDIARLLLDAGADANTSFDDGWGNPFTPITGAIGLGEGVKPPHPQAVPLVSLLLERGADPFDTQALYNTSIVHDDVGWMELLWSHCHRIGRTAEWSQRDGKSLGGKNKVGTLNYLLGNAVGQNHFRRAEWLLQHGANASTLHAYSGHAVHTVARMSGYTAMASLLEQHGAVPESLDDARLLVVAVMESNEPTMRSLVEREPSLIQRSGAFFAAASGNRAPSMRLLIDCGADVTMLDAEGATALHRAAHADAVDAIDVLLQHGAHVDARDARWRGTAMEWACVTGRHAAAEHLEGVTRDVRALARSGRLGRLESVLRESPALANELLTGHRQPTPLFCLPDDEELAAVVTQLLLTHGANVAVRNAQGQSAAQAARARGLDEAADLMSATS